MTTELPLTDAFEHLRPHLITVATRMLGSRSSAEDAVQEAWLRASAADRTDIANVPGWLTTIVARICLDTLRARKSREAALSAASALPATEIHEAIELADAVGPALALVLERLAPTERVALILHDVLGIEFAEIAAIIGRSVLATRQIASRARRRVRGTPDEIAADDARHRQVVEAFFAAARTGVLTRLVAILRDDVVVRADPAAVRLGASAETKGAEATARVFYRRSADAQPAVVDGAPGAVWSPDGRPKVAFAFTIIDDEIREIHLLADPARLGSSDLRWDRPADASPGPL